MKLTAKRLKEIIKEEMDSLNNLDEKMIGFTRDGKKFVRKRTPEEEQAAYMQRQYKGAEADVYTMDRLEPQGELPKPDLTGKRLVTRSSPNYLDFRMQRLQQRIDALTPKPGRIIKGYTEDERYAEVERLKAIMRDLNAQKIRRDDEMQYMEEELTELEESINKFERLFGRNR